MGLNGAEWITTNRNLTDQASTDHNEFERIITNGKFSTRVGTQQLEYYTPTVHIPKGNAQ